jgi:hypothetical protein
MERTGTCEWCDQAFVLGRVYWQRFCSDACRKDYHADRRAKEREALLEKETKSEERDEPLDRIPAGRDGDD